MNWVMRIIGTSVSLGLIVVSLMMNFRFGQSLGRTEWDGLVYGLASACADGFKVILPFAIMAAWGNRRRFAAAIGAALWLVFTAYSMTSSLGHSAVNRAETAGTKRHQIANYKDLRRSMELKLQEREKLPPFRAQEALEAEVTTARQNGAFERSAGCTDGASRTRAFCDGYAKIQSELATAKRARELDREIANFRTTLGSAAEVGKSGESDAQTAILKQVSGLGEDYVRLALTLLVSGMVELGSGLGLYVVLGHRPTREEQPATVTANGLPTEPVQPRLLPRSSNEMAWRTARLVDAPEGHESEIDLYRDYCSWLVEQNRGPALTLTDFRGWLEHQEVGKLVRKSGRNYYAAIVLIRATSDAKRKTYGPARKEAS